MTDSESGPPFTSSSSPPASLVQRRSSKQKKLKKQKGRRSNRLQSGDSEDNLLFDDDFSEDEDERQTLFENIGALLFSEKLSDVHFLVGSTEKERIPSHRLILSARSEVFEKMLFGRMKESKANSDIEVPDMHPSSFMAMLRFLYTAKTDLTPDNGMWSACSFFSFP